MVRRRRGRFPSGAVGRRGVGGPAVVGYGVVELSVISATLTNAVTDGTIRYRDYPMVGTARDHVIGEKFPVLGGRLYTSVNPVLDRLDRYP